MFGLFWRDLESWVLPLLSCCFGKICMKEKPLIYTKPRNYRKNMGLSMSVEDIWGFVRIMLLFPTCIGNKGTSVSNFVYLRSFQRHKKWQLCLCFLCLAVIGQPRAKSVGYSNLWLFQISFLGCLLF